MRISSIKGDPCYMPPTDHRRHFSEIYLDGEKQSLVLTADEETGEVLRYRRDANGRVEMDGEEVVTEVAKGDVRIILPPAEEAIRWAASAGRVQVAFAGQNALSEGCKEIAKTTALAKVELSNILSRFREQPGAAPSPSASGRA